MTAEDRELVKKILSEAMALGPGQQHDFIRKSAADRPDIAAEALDLLPQACNSVFMNSPTGAGLAGLDGGPPPLEAPGMRIGRYKLLQRIGEGGFGVVFLAEQVEPVVRRVALKIIKAGMDTRQVIARFEAERQALAMMDHPNIARVLDAGATEAGRPYFIMELVRGEPVTRYCDREQLSIEDRLMLFRDICGAVQHAHLKGIIHRDIKPSNVLVTMADGKPLPKVIDFGIAKATAVRLTDKTLFTEMHQLIGTPEYMSPEQAEVSGIDIDTRSDVYSLGVLLYELLAGGPPFEKSRMRSAPFAEIQRIIRDEEPPRPSLRLRTLASSNIVAFPAESANAKPSRDSSVMDIAKKRRTEPFALAKSLRGDLDWIVMKCLEKERGRRYETANALAGDITAYLGRQPVSATPPSATYKLRKMLQRRRGVVIASGAMAATLVVATIVSISFAVRASKALASEEAQRRLADKRAEETRQVAQFQSGLLSGIEPESLGKGFKDLFRSQVQEGLARQFVGEWPNRRKLGPEEVEKELSAYDRIAGAVQPVDIARRVLDEFILENDVEVVQTKFADQPRVQSELLHTLGSIYYVLALNDKAETALSRALELRQSEPDRDELALADTLTALASVKGAKAKQPEAEELHRQALAIYRAKLGDRHEKTIKSLDLIAITRFEQGDLPGAEALLREGLDSARQLTGENHAVLSQVLNDLGGLHVAKDDPKVAEPFVTEALAIRRKLKGTTYKELADALNNMAGVHYQKGDYAGSEKVLRESLEVQRKALGNEHTQVATIINNLASARFEQGDKPSAIQLFKESLEIYRRILGDDHPEVTSTLNNLAMMYQLSGDLKTAEPLLREALEMRRRQRGNDHPDVSISVSNLGYQLLKSKRQAEAEPLFREAVAIAEKKLEPKNSSWISPKIGLSQCLAEQGKVEESEAILTEIEQKVGYDGLPPYLRRSYVSSKIILYDAKHRADASAGFDRQAEEWRSKLQKIPKT